MDQYSVPYYGFQTAGSIVAGRNTMIQLVPRIQRMGLFRQVFIVAQPSLKANGIVDQIAGELSQAGMQVRITTEVRPEPTADQLREVFQAEVSPAQPDLLIGIGGGSVLDATKLFSVMLTNEDDVESMVGTDLVANPGMPTVLIPTTSGTGSEVTPNAIVTLPEQQLKAGVVSPYLLPKLVILDPVLTISLPKPITAATGMDAFTHALESYISNKANPISDMFALESIRLIAGSLLPSYSDGSDITAREKMLLGSMYGGMALTAAGTAAVHALAYPLGGQFHIPHGVANSMLLPHVMAYNLDAIAERLQPVARAMGLSGSGSREGGFHAAEAVIEQIIEWTRELDIPQNLRVFHVTEGDVEPLALAASKVTRLMNNNPKKMDLDAIQEVYRKLLP
ncbi:iron-containing alcohol dehydrogenase [Paenibacillus rigui]|uniref:iron-containing alcohol dehydrogenase n=1 Tax=Paenibacillus rigui TaxID=554312 RepID=UPI002481B23D|nr:iron-containing alcohol dehydrogenase [Paenibacillus rigui]